MLEGTGGGCSHQQQSQLPRCCLCVCERHPSTVVLWVLRLPHC